MEEVGGRGASLSLAALGEFDLNVLVVIGGGGVLGGELGEVEVEVIGVGF